LLVPVFRPMRRPWIFAAIALALLSFPTRTSLFRKQPSASHPAAAAAKAIAKPVQSLAPVDRVATQKNRADLPVKHTSR
jgi:hypothetical protein